MRELRPDAAARLTDGVVVETRLVARLLGVRVLRVDGVVHLSPAQVAERHATLGVPAGAVVDGGVESGPTAVRGDRSPPTVPGCELARAATLLRGLDVRLSAE
ncbi:hypothetical protein [Nocardioides taihuensis]|uniref:Uncharacterized protein n=1 Tax=Nocardioides taihuensis TaxID=1835606 RepID=A0ABW0BIB0_9ACTN